MATSDNIITLDVSPLTSLARELNSPQGRRELLGAMLALTQAVWSSAVSGEIFPPMQSEVISDDYYAAIWDERSVSWQGDTTVILDPSIAWDGAGALEEDKPPYDMKPQLLGGPKSHQMADGGRYVDIPFKHAGPTDDGSPRKGFASTMSPTVYRIVSQLPDWGRYNTSEPPITKARIGGMSAPFTHSTHIQNNMQKQPDGRGGSIFRTYRRVSSNSLDDSWWNPGKEGNPIVEAVVRETQKRIGEVVAGWVSDMSKHGFA